MEIRIEHLSMTYPSGKQALKDLNLELKAPSLIGLLGAQWGWQVNIDEAAGCGAPTYQRRNSGGRTLPYQNRAPAESPVGVFATGLRFV